MRDSVTAAIRSAVLDELAEQGHGRMSMESVARRAGVGKAALYRRWPSKDAMVNEVVLGAVSDALPLMPDTGSLREDVRELLDVFRSQLSQPGFRRIAADLLAESTRNEALADLLDDSVAKPRRAAVRRILEAAIERGELPGDLDEELAIDLLIAPLAFRILILRDPMDEARLEAVTDVICAGLVVARPTA